MAITKAAKKPDFPGPTEDYVWLGGWVGLVLYTSG